MAPRIVGWLLHRDNTCEVCFRRPAVVIVEPEEYTYESYEACKDCIPQGAKDPIMDVFIRVMEEK